MSRPLLLLVIAINCIVVRSQARPDHPAMMRMSGEPTENPAEGHDEATNSTTVDSMEDEDDDDLHTDHGEGIHVQGKMTSLCPARQNEVVEFEKMCLAEYKAMKKCNSTTTTAMPMGDSEMAASDEGSKMPAAEETTETQEMMSTTEKSRRKMKSRSCHYYQCILKKLDVLDDTGVPDGDLVQNWAMSNITDEYQRDQTQTRLKKCLDDHKSDFEEARTGKEESEEDSHEQKKEDNLEKLRCETSKKLICCLHHTECPILKFP